MQFNIKRNPEDFIVKEIIKLNGKKGDYLYVELIKTNRNTMDVISEIAEKLKIPVRFIGFAGNKDKRAITTQYLSIFKGNPEKIRQLKIENVCLKPLHFGSEPVYLGAAKGNYFRIKFAAKFQINKITKVANYYGEQRFSENNKEIGKALIKQDYQKACQLINGEQIKNYLKDHPKDYLGAVKTINRNLLSLYINAFQAHLWNEVAKQFIKDNFKNAVEFENLLFVENPKINIEIPLITFDTFIKQKNIRTYYNALLTKEGVSQEEYYLEDFPELIKNSAVRNLFIEVKNMKCNNEFLEFLLPTGSFATTVIKQIRAFTKKVQPYSQPQK